MKRNVLLSKIILEEKAAVMTMAAKVQRARTNLNEGIRLNEFFSASNYDPNFKIKKPWPNTKQETVLKRMQAKPYALGLNPHGYELDVDKDRLHFYNDKTVFSTVQSKTFGYEITSDNNIQLWNEPDGWTKATGYKVGIITDKTGKPTFIEDPANRAARGIVDPEAEEKAGESNSVMDTIQTILDWVGFIPVYGDIVDVINALIYFIRGKWFDGILSCLAIIPLIGTGIKMSVKAIYKGAKLEKLVKLITNAISSPKSAEKLWMELAQSGAIKPSMYGELGSGLSTLSKTLNSSYSTIKKIPGIDSKAIIKELEVFDEFLKNGGRSMDNMAAAVKKGDKLPWLQTAAKISTTKNTIILRLANSLTLRLIPKLKSMAFFSPEKISKIANGLSSRFMREMGDPTKLTALIKTSPLRKELITKMNTEIVSGISRLPVAKQALVATALKNANLSKVSDAKDVDKLLNILKSNPSTVGVFDSVSNIVTRHSMENGSMLWTGFKNTDMNNLKTLLSKDIIPGGSAWYKEFDFSLRKNLDIIWNEIHGAAEDLGIELTPQAGEKMMHDKYNEADAVVWPVIKDTIEAYWPWAYEKGKQVKVGVRNVLDSDFVKAAEEYVIGDKDAPYDPDAETKQGSGKYK
jgi:hypothetical protein